jgi:hypothetical protein
MLRYELFQNLPTNAVRFKANRLGACLEIHQLELVGRRAPAWLLLRRNGQRGLKGRPSGRCGAVPRGIRSITHAWRSAIVYV